VKIGILNNLKILSFFFVFLSYIELSNNERTDFKARELKSIHVDADGLFLKLIIHKNYVNRYNINNQVSPNIFKY
jgi:centrosomal protein CEP104